MQFILTDRIVKTRYKIDFRVWIEMVSGYAVNDEMQGQLLNAGDSIYRRCDRQAEEIIDQKICDGSTKLEVDDNTGSGWSKLAELLKALIAKETSVDKGIRQVQILIGIHRCVRGDGEMLGEFTGKFINLTARYSDQA